jgi:hypothetical protein
LTKKIEELEKEVLLKVSKLYAMADLVFILLLSMQKPKLILI